MIDQQLIGQTIATYKVEALIGRGGMSRVYRAFDTRLQRSVALKVLAGPGDDESGRRFEREAMILAQLAHPHIVTIYDSGTYAGVTYMVQELLAGPTLEQQLQALAERGEQLGRDEVIAILDQLAAALDVAHAAGVIHRDVKPSNAIWSAAGHLVLTDFGVARSALSDKRQTTTGIICGTPAYLSPEQAEGGTVTAATDVYALGALLFELLTGRPPFDGPTALAVLLQHLQAPPPLLGELRPDLPAALEAVVARALAKRPEQRYASAGELARAVQQAWPRETAGARSVLTPYDMPTLAAMAVSAADDTPSVRVAHRAPRRPPARRAWFGLAAVPLLLVAFLAGLWQPGASGRMLANTGTMGEMVANWGVRMLPPARPAFSSPAGALVPAPTAAPQPSRRASATAAPTAVATAPRATAAPPTATVVPPTATALLPTATALPPSATAVPPTALPPTATVRGRTQRERTPAQTVPSATAVPPAATAVPPSREPVVLPTSESVLPEATAVPATAVPAPAELAPTAVAAPPTEAVPSAAPTDVPATPLPLPTVAPPDLPLPTVAPPDLPLPTVAPLSGSNRNDDPEREQRGNGRGQGNDKDKDKDKDEDKDEDEDAQQRERPGEDVALSEPPAP
jgi:eukaryotic-like serine/threonine-protein kinase